MRLPLPSRSQPTRSGKTLVLFVLLLPVLIGWIGLSIDGGMLLASHRQAQNAADAAALAAARDKLSGKSDSTALATANTYIQQYNGLSGAPDLISGQTFNIPPKQGPYAGNSQYVEVIVANPTKTFFVHILGGSQSRTATARAVAGIQAASSTVAAAVLDPSAVPGITLNGGAKITANGPVLANSTGSGYDQNGKYLNTGSPPYAVSLTGNASLVTSDLEVVGGVSTPASIQNTPGNSGSPLHAGVAPAPDPLLSLPTPTTSNGVVNKYWGLNNRGQWQQYNSPQNVSISGNGSVTFNPGIYGSISISGSGTVTFNPGIYVLTGASSSTFSVSGSPTINGNGIMFYNTGSDYDPISGVPDVNDGNTLGTPPPSTKFGKVSFSGGGTTTLNPLSDPTSPFDGMLFYQRRWNTNQFNLSGNGTNTTLAGTLYGKWAKFELSGQGTYSAEFVTGSLVGSGQATITINTPSSGAAKSSKVYLVE